MARISKKQIALLKVVNAAKYMGGQGVVCWHLVPEDIYFTFRTESSLLKWLHNLEQRGFLQFENQDFMRITALGKQIISGLPEEGSKV